MFGQWGSKPLQGDTPGYKNSALKVVPIKRCEKGVLDQKVTRNRNLRCRKVYYYFINTPLSTPARPL